MLKLSHISCRVDNLYEVAKQVEEAECYVLKQDRYQIEMLTNLDKIPERGAIIFCIFVKQTNGTGFPVRCFAICPNK